MINKSIRELDRERTSLQNSEKKLITDIKKAAKDGQMVSSTLFPPFALALTPGPIQKTVKIHAKDLVRTRQYVTKFYEMRSQLQAISLRLEVNPT
jgi:charged multivesicular body protein 2A